MMLNTFFMYLWALFFWKCLFKFFCPFKNLGYLFTIKYRDSWYILKKTLYQKIFPLWFTYSFSFCSFLTLGHSHGMQKFSCQGLKPCHSSNQSHKSDNAGLNLLSLQGILIFLQFFRGLKCWILMILNLAVYFRISAFCVLRNLCLSQGHEDIFPCFLIEII